MRIAYHYMVKDILICGPGRNGSTSMFALLANCKNTHIKHFCPVTRETKIKNGSKRKTYKYRISIGPDNIDKFKIRNDIKTIFLFRAKRDIVNSLKKFRTKMDGLGIEEYVEEYFNKAKQLEGKNFKSFHVSMLNSKQGQKKIFDYLEIEEDDRRYMRECHFNKS